MGEIELQAIEGRTGEYPDRARQDILMLTRELRRMYEADERRKSEQAKSPLYDVATGLLNAGAYGVRFAMARARATRFRKIFAVMSVDLDLSREDIGSEAEVERVVRVTAERLESCVRATDTLARIGERNFAVILEDLVQTGHAERVKQIVQDALAEPMQVGMRDLVPPAHVQLQFYPSPRADQPPLHDA